LFWFHVPTLCPVGHGSKDESRFDSRRMVGFNGRYIRVAKTLERGS
jgi:hypothetical protein